MQVITITMTYYEFGTPAAQWMAREISQQPRHDSACGQQWHATVSPVWPITPITRCGCGKI